MAACGILSTSSSRWSARPSGNARSCGRWHRTSSGRCGLCCRIIRACAPAWLLRLGLFLYDHIGGRKLLPATSSVDLASTTKPARRSSRCSSKAFEYSDCWVEDSRLVVLNALDAAQRGASLLPPHQGCPRATHRGPVAHRDASHASTARRQTVTAGIVVNAAGPWVDTVLKQVFGQNDARNVRLVRGSRHCHCAQIRPRQGLHLPERRHTASSSPYPMKATTR